MNIKNYTSTVPAKQSIMNIEELLVKAGANHISKVYEDSEVTGFLFQIPVNGAPLVFKLPSRVDLVFKQMWSTAKTKTKTAEENAFAQARRTAWKLLHEWVHIQVSMITLQQVELLQVFLPYAYDHKTNQTYFDKVQSGEIKLLQS